MHRAPRYRCRGLCGRQSPRDGDGCRCIGVAACLSSLERTLADMSTLDDLLVQHVGQFGRGQLILLGVSGLGACRPASPCAPPDSVLPSRAAPSAQRQPGWADRPANRSVGTKEAPQVHPQNAPACLPACSTGWAGLALQLFLCTFTAVDPLSSGWWQCASTQDQCTGAAGVCALPPGELVWTHPERSVVAEFSLICDDAWKVWRLAAQHRSSCCSTAAAASGAAARPLPRPAQAASAMGHAAQDATAQRTRQAASSSISRAHPCQQMAANQPALQRPCPCPPGAAPAHRASVF